MQRKDYSFIIITALIPIIFWNFYWYVGFNTNITKLFGFIFGLYFVCRYFTGVVKGLHTSSFYNPYSKSLSLFIVVIFLSILNAFVFWGQSPDLTFRSGVSIFVLLSYYYFEKKNPSQENLERVVFLLAIIYYLLWLYALSQAPRVVFGNLESLQDDRGYYRILQLAGLDTVVFVYFWCLSRVSFYSGTKRFIVFATIVVCAIAIFMSLTRMVILAAIAITIFYIVRKKSIVFIIVSLVAVIVASDYILSNDIVVSLLDLTSDVSMSDQRAPEYTMAFKLYPFHISTALFGNGSEHIASSYGQMEAYLKSAYAFNRSDAGFVSIYVTYGIVGVILLLGILWKVIKQKVSNRNYYLKLMIYFIFLVNLTAYHFSDYGFTLALSLYLLARDNDNQIAQAD